MKQYIRPEIKINTFESNDIIMTSNNAFNNIMTQLTETFGVDKSAIDSQKYENWGQDNRFE